MEQQETVAQQQPNQTFEDSRFGLFTASEIHRLMASGSRPMTTDELAEEKTKGGKRKTVTTLFGDGALTYIEEKVNEFLTGEKKPEISNWACDWGKNNEKDAVMFFEMITGKKVQHFGVAEYRFFPYKTIGGCSPDGLVIGEKANIQVKCPANSSNHSPLLRIKGDRQKWLKNNHFDYYCQCQFEMMCTDCEKCYFVSYDPRTIEHYHRMAVIELMPDDEIQNDIAERILQAAVLLHDTIQELETPDPIYNTIINAA